MTKPLFLRNHIVFTGDILQTNFDGSPKMYMETRWLADLLRYQVSLACPEVPMDVVTWEIGVPSFDAARFFELNGMRACVEDWARLESAESITDAAAEYFAGFFEGAVVIGNTMSNFQIRLFEQLGIPYLDFILHPARFLDDIFFGLRTNSPEMFEALQQSRYPDDAIRLQAAIHRAGLRRPPPAEIPAGSGLFTAQHGIDKALVKDGMLCDIEDYREELTDFVSRHPYVYVKPHPYARQTARIVAFLRALAGDSRRIRVTNENIYSLFANDNVTEVCGISSCAVYEAEYFGKPATYLSGSRIRLSAAREPLDPAKYVPVYDAFYNPGFWRRLLEGVCRVSTCPDIVLPRKTSRLRNSLSLYWGYGHLDWEIPLRTIGIYPPAGPSERCTAWENQQLALQEIDADNPQGAADYFAAALIEEETAERWEDWAAAQRVLGRLREAEDGYRMAAARANPWRIISSGISADQPLACLAL